MRHSRRHKRSLLRKERFRTWRAAQRERIIVALQLRQHFLLPYLAIEPELLLKALQGGQDAEGIANRDGIRSTEAAGAHSAP